MNKIIPVLFTILVIVLLVSLIDIDYRLYEDGSFQGCISLLCGG